MAARSNSKLTARGLRAPRLKLAPLRPQASVALDSETHRDIPLPPFVPWNEFTNRFRFEQGEHVTLVATTGSGKTSMMRELFKYREYVCVLGTKAKDDNLYPPLEKAGFKLERSFNPDADATGLKRVIYAPHLSTPDRAGFNEQAEDFRRALFEIYGWGSWAVGADEIRYLTETLGLAATFEVLWLQGRSLGISVIAATQEPVSIPLMAFSQATHLFLGRNTDRVRVDRMAEFAGEHREVARATIPKLPKYEFLYVDTRTGEMCRTKLPASLAKG